MVFTTWFVLCKNFFRNLVKIIPKLCKYDFGGIDQNSKQGPEHLTMAEYLPLQVKTPLHVAPNRKTQPQP